MHVHVLTRHIESGEEVVHTLTKTQEVDARMMKAAGWLPVRAISHEAFGCERKPQLVAGFPAHAAYLRP